LNRQKSFLRQILKGKLKFEENYIDELYNF